MAETFSSPDDPYRVEAGFREDGSFVISVSADVLAGDDESTAEVRAECARIAASHRRRLLGTLSPPEGREPSR